jgi:hypothetical protein
VGVGQTGSYPPRDEYSFNSLDWGMTVFSAIQHDKPAPKLFWTTSVNRYLDDGLTSTVELSFNRSRPEDNMETIVLARFSSENMISYALSVTYK